MNAAADMDIRPRIGLRQARVTPVTTRYAHIVLAYHAEPVWNRQGTHLLYLGVNDPGAPADVVVQDCSSGEETVLATTTTYDFHTAAGQRWALDDTAVVFKSEREDGRRAPAMVRLDQPGESRILQGLVDCSIRRLSDDSRFAYGSNGPAAVRMDLQSEELTVLATLEEALPLFPAEAFDPSADHSFNHVVANGEQTRIFCKIVKPQAQRRYATDWGAFYVKDLVDGELRCLGTHISGHPIWAADGRHIINVKRPDDDSDNRWLVLVDSVSGRDERLVDLPIEGPGHPALSPTARYLATDAFPPDHRQSPIYVIDLQTGGARELARLHHRFEPQPYTGLCRGQPHPCWSPDGRQLVVNCNEGGTRLGLRILSDFLPEA